MDERKRGIKRMPIVGEISKAIKIGRKGRHKYIWHSCIDCGKERWVMLYNGEPESLRCISCSVKGENSPNYGKHIYGEESPHWNGGRKKHEGYILIWTDKNTPFISMRNFQGYIYEHRLIMAKNLSRPLNNDEFVHHINEIKNDNRIENLMLLTNSEHVKLHYELNKVR
jgi:hypothetical protein